MSETPRSPQSLARPDDSSNQQLNLESNNELNPAFSASGEGEGGEEEEEDPDNPTGFHNGRPIPKQTAAGALLTGGLNTHKVYIGNLPETATLADLEDCFGQLGQCTCSLKRGFGFVDYTEPASAAEAVAKYHEGHFLGAQIKVELSHARASIPKAPEDGKVTARNPPGSDRPSDTRKPMHINGPPTQRPGGHQGHGGDRPPRFNNARGGGNNNFREPRGPPQNDYSSRRGSNNNNNDRWAPAPSRDAPPPPPPPFRNGDGPSYGGGNDRYRDDYRDSRDYSAPPPPPPHLNYQDPRYPPRDFDRYSSGPPPPPSRDLRGPPPPLGGYNNGPGSNREPRDRPPYDPYYDLPPRGNSSSDFPPYAPPPPPLSSSHRLSTPMSPIYHDRSQPPSGPPGPPSGRGGDPYDRYALPPPHSSSSSSFDGPLPNSRYDNYDLRGPPLPLLPLGSSISVAPGGREERNNRFNPYSRGSPPPLLSHHRDDGRNGGGYGGRSPRGPPPNDRRRSMSPPPRFGNGPPPPFNNNYDNNNLRGPSGGYGGGDRYGGKDEYNPRR